MNSLGFIGVGDLADYTITGLQLGGFKGSIYLSPRNAAMSARLAETHDCHILTSNQAVADSSDCLIISTRPTLIYPDHKQVSDLFDYCGDSICVDSEAAFDQGSVLACVYTWYFSLFEQIIQSTTSEALPADKAKALVLGMAKGAASLALQKSETSGEIAEAIATEGTFSKLGLDVLKNQGAFAPWDEACELLMDRLS